MKVASSKIVTYLPVKRDAAQAEAKDLAVRESVTGAILEAITGNTQIHFFN